MKKTKIICTMGPNTNDRELIKQLALNGMDIARFNFSHGDHEEQAGRFALVKSVREEINKPIATLLDTKGPEIRTGVLKDDKKVTLKEGQKFTLTTREIVGDETIDMITYAGLPADVDNGNTILIDDGLIELRVEEVVDGTDIVCTVINGGELGSKKGVNVPNVSIKLPGITDKDKDDIIFGIEQGFDFIAASFVRRAQDIQDIRDILASKNNSRIKIISKIENQEGVENMEEIIALSDGVMVARGDLGVDVDAWDLPQIQKEMIFLAQASGKIVVTATQMLDSMQQNPRPTRAEVSDVHNAVLDGTGATMLSGESAQGDYPLEAVTYMAKIDEKAEDYIDHELMIENVLNFPTDKNEIDAIGLAVAQVCMNFEVAAVVAEGDQELAFKISQYRPASDVFYATADRADCRTLQLAWGIQPVHGSLADAYTAAVEKLGLEKGESILEVTKDGVKFTQVK